jgi:hypothetical protein
MNSWKPFKLSVLVIRHTMIFQGEEGVSAFSNQIQCNNKIDKLALVCGMGSVGSTYYD